MSADVKIPESRTCLLCGKSADHGHVGGYDCCGGCCANWGGVAHTDERAYKWIDEAIIPHLQALTADRDLWQRKCELMASAVTDEEMRAQCWMVDDEEFKGAVAGILAARLALPAQGGTGEKA